MKLRPNTEIRVSIAGVTAALCLTLFAAEEVAAQSNEGVCRGLEARLASIDNGQQAARQRSESRNLDESIRRQSEELRRTRRAFRRAKCGGGLFGTGIFGRRGSDQACQKLDQSISEMERSLAQLERRRANVDSAPIQIDTAERQRIVEAMARNNCRIPEERFAERDRRGRGLFASLFGRRRTGWAGRDYDSGFGPDFGYGTFRTLCVRACDGYYFPISFSTTNDNFYRDEAVCHSMCPAGNASLYVHRNPGEESEQMVTLFGEPYASLENAFRYRKEYDPSCTCGTIQVSLDEVTQSDMSISLPPVELDRPFLPEFETVSISIPRPRHDEAVDPDTRFNRAGSFTPNPIIPGESSRVAELTDPSQRRVRVVGPAYFYGRSAEEAGPAPDPVPAQ